MALLLMPVVHAWAAETPSEKQSLDEVRNTIVNLLQTMVDRGLLTREQAAQIVKQAQEKASTEAAALASKNAAQAKEEENAVRVPYVPQIVQDQIAQQVATELGPSVKKELVDQVSSKGSLYAALPEWVQRMRWSGDIRVRDEGDLFASGNAQYSYLDFNQINAAGGISKAGTSAFLNTTTDENRLRVRARFGFDTDLGAGWTTGVRLATGSIGEIIATTNQSLGTYGAGYTTTLNQAYLRWTGQSASGRQLFTATGGRFDNPFVSTDLVWYNDLAFEGLVANYRVNMASQATPRHDLFFTLGGFPLSNYSPFNSNPTTEQKWLLAGQLGADFRMANDSRVRFGAAYYDYVHTIGRRNEPDSTLYNWTAPAFVQKGNTMFNIANSLDPTVQLFALAANYHIVDLIMLADLHVAAGHSLGVTLEAVRNVGYNVSQVQQNVGTYVAPRVNGWRADIGFGTSTAQQFGSWRATVGYRYLQRDAVFDAFNDEDFHLGGTDAKGYTLAADFSLTPRVWLRMRYLSANQIDLPPLGIDVYQLDVNAQF